MNTRSNGMFEAALAYAENGVMVFPLHTANGFGVCSCGTKGCENAGKHPRTAHGFKDATDDRDQVTKWWQQWPDANIGTPTGEGLVVLDIDPRNGGMESIAQLQEEQGVLPETRQQATGGDGFHFFFKVDQALRSRTGIRPGIDLKAEGGYVVLPPSMHASGKRYRWLKQSRTVQIPPWLVKLRGSENGDVTAGAGKDTPNTIPQGARNQTLMSLAGSMRQRGMSSDEIYNAIQGVNTHRCEPPLLASEVQSIATSAARYQPSGFIFTHTKPTDKEAWLDRQELPALTHSVPTLPQNLLPGALKPWLVDVSDRLQVPLEFVAAPAIVTLGAVVGRQVGICPKEYDDWCVIPNLWGGVVARPGMLKTASIQEALGPLGQLVAQSRERYRQEEEEAQPKLEAHNALIKAVKDRMKSTAKKKLVKLEGWAENREELERLEQELRELEADAKAFEVKEQRYKTNDPTVEKLAVLLAENPRGLLLGRDELSGWLRSLERTGREGDREFFLESWNGTGSYTVDRIGRGTLHVDALCLSIFGGIQPGKLGRYVREALEGGFADDGLLQRFQILVHPDPGDWKFVDRRPDQEARERAYRIFARLDRLDADALGVTEESSSGVPILRFSGDAQELFNTWLVELEERLHSGKTESPAFESFLAKFRSLMPSLSLLFHLVEWADGKVAANGITRESAAQAAAWCDFLEAHAMKIYAGAIHPDVESAHALAKRIESGEVRDGDSIKDIYRHGWSLLSSRSDVVGAIGVLEDCHWLRVQKPGGQGRPSEVVRLHPDFTGADS